MNYLAGSLDGFAQSSAARFAIEYVRDEEILGSVHYESALFDVAADSQERQITHPTLSYEFVVLKLKLKKKNQLFTFMQLLVFSRLEFNF